MSIRPYSKKELALAYAPYLSMSGALNRLARWISINKKLTDALNEMGYDRNQRFFTTEQVRLIFEYLGEPC